MSTTSPQKKVEPEKCDICMKKDGWLGLKLSTCKVCKVNVHKECYGLGSNHVQDFTCWACWAVGKSFQVDERLPNGERRRILQKERPMRCELCSIDDEIHAMHPLYDYHGLGGRQIMCTHDMAGQEIERPRLAWVHSLCAFFLSAKEGLVYGCGYDGFYDGSDDTFVDDRSANSAVIAEHEDQEDGSVHHFAYNRQRPGQKMNRWIRAVNLHKKQDRCMVCGYSDNFPSMLRIAMPCSANTRNEYKPHKDRHIEMDPDEVCMVSVHIGCAQWGPEASVPARRVYFFPGVSDTTARFNEPTCDCYCNAHAVDVAKDLPPQQSLITQPRMRRNTKRKLSKYSPPVVSEGRAKLIKRGKLTSDSDSSPAPAPRKRPPPSLSEKPSTNTKDPPPVHSVENFSQSAAKSNEAAVSDILARRVQSAIPRKNSNPGISHRPSESATLRKAITSKPSPKKSPKPTMTLKSLTKNTLPQKKSLVDPAMFSRKPIEQRRTAAQPLPDEEQHLLHRSGSRARPPVDKLRRMQANASRDMIDKIANLYKEHPGDDTLVYQLIKVRRKFWSDQYKSELLPGEFDSLWVDIISDVDKYIESITSNGTSQAGIAKRKSLSNRSKKVSDAAGNGEVESEKDHSLDPATYNALFGDSDDDDDSKKTAAKEKEQQQQFAGVSGRSDDNGTSSSKIERKVAKNENDMDCDSLPQSAESIKPEPVNSDDDVKADATQIKAELSTEREVRQMIELENEELKQKVEDLTAALAKKEEELQVLRKDIEVIKSLPSFKDVSDGKPREV